MEHIIFSYLFHDNMLGSLSPFYIHKESSVLCMGLDQGKGGWNLEAC